MRKLSEGVIAGVILYIKNDLKVVNQGNFQQETIASMALVSQSLELYMRVGLMMLMITGRLFFLQLLPFF